jgi:uncharacterized delta-60 repeat protein
MLNNISYKLINVFLPTLLLLLLTNLIIASPGDLDLTFNSTGYRITDVTASNNDEAKAMAIQPDGKIVAVGYSLNLGEFALVRYTTSGALDTTFGTGGIVRSSFSAQADLRAVTLQADGKIVVGGYLRNVTSSRNEFALARYTSTGVLDPTFGGGDGVATMQIGSGNSLISGLAIQSDGKIVAVGEGAVTSGRPDFVTVRYLSSGDLDSSFGIQAVDFLGNSFDYAYAVKLQSDGKIVVAGYVNDPFTAIGVVRYQTNGTLDTSFDGDGRVVTQLSAAASSLVIQPDSKIVVGATGSDYNLVRYTTIGSLDTSFGGGTGIVTVDVGSSDIVGGIALDTSGNIIVAGSGIVGKSNRDIFVARHLTNGNLDPVFDAGGDGIVTTSLGTNFDNAYAVAMQTDCKIVLAGTAGGPTGNGNFAVLRYVGIAPTAAQVTLGGRITTVSGTGVSGVYVTLSGGSLPQPLVALTNSFGYYNFYDIPVGSSYVLTPTHHSYTFSPTNLLVNLMDEYLNANFTAIE